MNMWIKGQPVAIHDANVWACHTREIHDDKLPQVAAVWVAWTSANARRLFASFCDGSTLGAVTLEESSDFYSPMRLTMTDAIVDEFGTERGLFRVGLRLAPGAQMEVKESPE